MNVQIQPDVKAATQHLPFEVVALVLQGGGALGAYQAGVYEALAEAAIIPIGSTASRSVRSTRP
jgi:NTE family protein